MAVFTLIKTLWKWARRPRKPTFNLNRNTWKVLYSQLLYCIHWVKLSFIIKKITILYFSLTRLTCHGYFTIKINQHHDINNLTFTCNLKSLFSNIYGFSPLCVWMRRCVGRFEEVENPFLHISHVCGFYASVGSHMCLQVSRLTKSLLTRIALM